MAVWSVGTAAVSSVVCDHVSGRAVVGAVLLCGISTFEMCVSHSSDVIRLYERPVWLAVATELVVKETVGL